MMSDVNFAQNSVLDILIPQKTDLDIEEALASAETVNDNDDDGLITSIPQRNLLYFGKFTSSLVSLLYPFQL